MFCPVKKINSKGGAGTVKNLNMIIVRMSEIYKCEEKGCQCQTE